jgi:hypothetical protein
VEKTMMLDNNLAHKVEQLAREIDMLPEDICSQAINNFIDTHHKTSQYSPLLGPPESWVNSYELGKKYFEQEGSGIGNLSTTYKQRLREKYAAKLNTHRLGSAHSAV